MDRRLFFFRLNSEEVYTIYRESFAFAAGERYSINAPFPGIIIRWITNRTRRSLLNEMESARFPRRIAYQLYTILK